MAKKKKERRATHLVRNVTEKIISIKYKAYF